MAHYGTIRDHRTNRDARATADDAAMHPRRSLGLAVGAAVLAATVGFGPTASATPNITRYPYRTPCPLPFPSTNVWNKRVDTLPVRTDSATLIASMGTAKTLHPDFGSFAGLRDPGQPRVRLDAALDGRLPVAGRVGPGRLPDPGLSPDRGGRGARRPPHPDGRPERLPAVGAVRARASPAATGRPAPGRPGTSARTRSARTAGRPPTPRGCRSTRASRGTTRSRPGRSPTRCGSRCRRRGRPTSTPRATTRAPDRARRCRRWACASG